MKPRFLFLLMAFAAAAAVAAPSSSSADSPGWLGLRVTDAQDGSVRVISTCPDGPAQKGGVLPWDKVLSFNGKPVAGARALSEAIRAMKPGSAAAMEVEHRSGARRALTLSVSAPPELVPQCPLLPNLNVPALGNHIHPNKVRMAYIGVQVQEMTPELRSYFGVPGESGVLVVKVDPDGPAKGLLEVGDVLSAVNGTPLRCGADLIEGLRGSEHGDRVRFEVFRDRRPLNMDLTVSEKEKMQFYLDSFFEQAAGHANCPKGGQDCQYLWHWNADDFEASLKRLQQMVESDAFEKQLREQTIQKKQLEDKLRMLERKLRELEQKIASGGAAAPTL